MQTGIQVRVRCVGAGGPMAAVAMAVLAATSGNCVRSPPERVAAWLCVHSSRRVDRLADLAARPPAHETQRRIARFQPAINGAGCDPCLLFREPRTKVMSLITGRQGPAHAEASGHRGSPSVAHSSGQRQSLPLSGR